MKIIGSVNYELGSYELNKASLSCFNDKRYVHTYLHSPSLIPLLIFDRRPPPWFKFFLFPAFRCH